jgi:hypothetical protein
MTSAVEHTGSNEVYKGRGVAALGLSLAPAFCEGHIVVGAAAGE